MPVLSPQQAIWIGLFVAPAVFAVCAFPTRANLRRAVSGLPGVAAYCAVQYAWDRLAARLGWWSYPAYETSANSPMPTLLYILSGVVYAGFAFIGWRATRRYGWKGLLVFLTAWSLWGFFLDNVGSALFSASRLMILNPGAAAKIADFLVYFTCMGAALLTLRLFGGPFRSDLLARQKKQLVSE